MKALVCARVASANAWGIRVGMEKGMRTKAEDGWRGWKMKRIENRRRSFVVFGSSAGAFTSFLELLILIDFVLECCAGSGGTLTGAHCLCVREHPPTGAINLPED